MPDYTDTNISIKVVKKLWGSEYPDSISDVQLPGADKVGFHGRSCRNQRKEKEVERGKHNESP